MKIKAAIFDMDGTIIDSLFYWESFWRELGKTYLGKESFDYDREVDRRVRTMIFPQAIALIHSFYHLPCTIEELAHFSSGALSDFYEYEAKVKEGTFALFDHLKREGIKICLASATEMKYVKHALRCHKLHDYFDEILSCADIGCGKDKPDIYLAALKALDVAPDEACVFEDSYVALETAKSIGCHTVGIYDPNNYGQDRLAAASDIYIAEGQSFTSVIPDIHKGEV